MPIKLIRRGDTWYLRGTVRGVRVYETTGTENADAAEQIRIRREAQILDRSINGEGRSHTFGELALMYMERPGARTREDRFTIPLSEHFAQTPLDKIDQYAVDRFIASKKGRVLKSGEIKAISPATVQRQIITPLTAVMRYGAQLGWCKPPMFNRPKTTAGRVRWLNHEEADRLIGCIAPHLRPLLIFLFYTGARMSEALELEWLNVDLAKAVVRFEVTKTGERRTVPLHSRVIEALKALPGREGVVFLNRDGFPYQNTNRTAGGQIKHPFDTACRKAGITDFRPHDCRHTFASWLALAGTPLLTLAELMGHKSLSMVKRYAHLSSSHLADAISALPGAKSVQSNNEGGIVL